MISSTAEVIETLADKRLSLETISWIWCTWFQAEKCCPPQCRGILQAQADRNGDRYHLPVFWQLCYTVLYDFVSLFSYLRP